MGSYTVVAALNAFHIVGGLLAIWAITVTALGVRRENFPGSNRQAYLVGAISVVLALGAISSAIIVGALENKGKGGGEAKASTGAPPPPPGAPAGAPLHLAADPSGQLKFDKSTLQSKPGRVTIAMRNPSPVPHDIAIEGGGLDQKGKVVQGGGTSTVSADLKPGKYAFYCSVDSHRQGGMKGTLTVQ